MTEEVTVIHTGRGPQLSNNRITVYDLVPYFRTGCTYEEIMRWIPSLSATDIALLEGYYRAHKDELDERDRKIDEYRAEQSRLQHLRFPSLEGTPEERMAQLRKRLHDKLAGRNGSTTSSGQ
jgi:uncharacterized protein (DUF433 family)